MRKLQYVCSTFESLWLTANTHLCVAGFPPIVQANGCKCWNVSAVHVDSFLTALIVYAFLFLINDRELLVRMCDHLYFHIFFFTLVCRTWFIPACVFPYTVLSSCVVLVSSFLLILYPSIIFLLSLPHKIFLYWNSWSLLISLALKC